MVAQLLFDSRRNIYTLDGLDVSINRMLKVLVWNEEKKLAEWIPTRMVYDEKIDQWNLVGLWGFHIAGLYAEFL